MKYLEIAGEASSRGYSVTFLGVTVLAVIGCACVSLAGAPAYSGRS